MSEIDTPTKKEAEPVSPPPESKPASQELSDQGQANMSKPLPEDKTVQFPAETSSAQQTEPGHEPEPAGQTQPSVDQKPAESPQAPGEQKSIPPLSPEEEKMLREARAQSEEDYNDVQKDAIDRYTAPRPVQMDAGKPPDSIDQKTPGPGNWRTQEVTPEEESRFRQGPPLEPSVVGRPMSEKAFKGQEAQPAQTPDAGQNPQPPVIRPSVGDTSNKEWKDHGIINVPVKDLPSSDDVSGPQDFNHHISWDDAQKASAQLPDIQKELAEGKTKEDFYREDQAKGLGPMEGKEAVYNLYYGNDPVAVEKVDGQYNVLTGRHRIAAAKAAGLTTIPAWVREKR